MTIRRGFCFSAALNPLAERAAHTRAKRAPTCVVSPATTVQTPVPVQAPLQPTKREALLGSPRNSTFVPAGNGAVQVGPHEIPLGRLVTVP